MLRKTCSRCGELILYGTDCSCSAQSKRERNRAYDSTVRHARDADLTVFYHSGEWRVVQPYIIAKYSGLDIYAYFAKREITPATVVHHVKPLRESWESRLDEGNLIPLSAESHGEIEALYKTSKKQDAQAMLRRLMEEWEKEFGG